MDIFLCGDVMTGRGIDQVLPHSVEPSLYEAWITDARDYVALAQQANGPVPAPVDFPYPWGDALGELARAAPHARVINLETSITHWAKPWPGKGIHYRMHPSNLAVLTVAGIDCCVLANNHVLDWGREGLQDTLHALHDAGLATPGAGADAAEARRPAVIGTAAGRLLVYGCGHGSSGIPAPWAAGDPLSGVNLLPDLSADTARRIGEHCRPFRRPGDRLIVSIHWGPNWGYDVPDEHITFAHDLVDLAGADIVHGHSSHHVKSLEVYRGRLVLYGCGDLINDYEGISGYERYRSELSALYFVHLGPQGELQRLRMVLMRMRRLRLERAGADDARWLQQTLVAQGPTFNTRLEPLSDNTLELRWT